MKRGFALVVLIVWLACTNQAFIEVGMNDATLLAGVYGDLIMNVTKIEIAETNNYSTVWEGHKSLLVSIQSPDYVTLTDDWVQITPGEYRYMRVTADSLRYDNNITITMLHEQSFDFVAQAFSNILVDENDEIQLVILINSNNWLELDSLRIIPGKSAFEGAALRIHYE